MQAIILAGGFGTRLSGVVGSDVPKPMAPVAGRPYLEWLLDYAAEQGISEVVLCVHYLHEKITGYFGDRYRSIRLHYSYEDVPLGTGGAVKKALALLKSENPVFVMNGDSLVQLDYLQMLAQHYAHGRKLTMATRRAEDCSRYSTLRVRNNLIEKFDLLGDENAGDISVGFYIVAPDIFAGYALPKTFSIEKDFFAHYIPKILPAAFAGVHYFIDIGVPQDFALAQTELLNLLLGAVAA